MPDHVPEGMVEYLDKLSVEMREAKEEFVRDGPADLPPKFIWYFTGATDEEPDEEAQFIELPVAEICNDVPGTNPVEVLGQIVPQFRGVAGPAWGVVFVTEGYYVKVKDTTHTKPGSLAQRFGRGDPAVSEAVVLTVADRENMVTRFMPFRYGDGSVVWEEQSDTVIKTRGAHATNTNVPLVVSLAFGTPDGGMN